MSIFGSDDSGFSLTPGGDTAPKKKPVPTRRTAPTPAPSSPSRPTQVPPRRNRPMPPRRTTTPPPSSSRPSEEGNRTVQENDYPTSRHPQETENPRNQRPSGIPSMPRSTPSRQEPEFEPSYEQYNTSQGYSRDVEYENSNDSQYEDLYSQTENLRTQEESYREPSTQYDNKTEEERLTSYRKPIEHLEDSTYSELNRSNDYSFPKEKNLYENDFNKEEEARQRASTRTLSDNTRVLDESKGKSKGKKSRKGKEKVEKEPGAFYGARKRVLITNIVGGTVILSILGFGLNSIFNPPYIPSPDDMTTLMKSELNITEFNKEAAKPIVASFVKEFFSEVPEQDKTRKLMAYTTEEMSAEIVQSLTVNNGTKLSPNGEPVIINAVSKNSNNANYTVGIKIDNKWVYIDVPVFYDQKNKAYAISGVPSFVPPPTIAEIGSALEDPMDSTTMDTEVTTETSENIVSFLKAWSVSDAEALSRYITSDATQNAKLGLQGTAFFDSIETYEVYYLPDGTLDEEHNRVAKVAVIWKNSDKSPTVKYRQQFDIKLYKQPDNRWYIADISPTQTDYEAPGTANKNEPIEVEVSALPEE